jgi:hypothetical protein
LKKVTYKTICFGDGRLKDRRYSAELLVFRNLEARTDNGELLNLMDATGCPLNELIFPALALESASRALYANFKVIQGGAFIALLANFMLCP